MVPDSWSDTAKALATELPESGKEIIIEKHFGLDTASRYLKMDALRWGLQMLSMKDGMWHGSEFYPFLRWLVCIPVSDRAVAFPGVRYLYGTGPTHEIAFLNAFDEYMIYRFGL